MTSLQQYQADITVNNETGESFMSQRGLARVCGINESTLRSWATARKIETKQAEVLTPGGLQGARLFAEKDIAAAIVKYNPTLAEQLMQLGVRVLLHKMAGFKVASPVKTLSDREVMEVAMKALDERLQQERFCDDKPGLLNIIRQASTHVKLLEPKPFCLQDICSLHFDVELTQGQLSSLGRYVAGEYKSWHRQEPPKELVEIAGVNRRVSVYTSVMYPVIENWLRHEGHIS